MNATGTTLSAQDGDLFAQLRADGAGRDRCREQLVERYGSLAVSLARRYRGRGETDDDLLQVAYLGLLEALDRFDPERGIEFARFAYPTILGLLRRHFRDGRRWVRIPRRLQQLVADIRDAQETLASRNDRTPSLRELAEYLDASESEIGEAMLGNQFFAPTSLDAPTTEDGDLTLADQLGGEDNRIDILIGCTAVLPLVNALPERERDIVISTFWHEEPQTSIGRRWGVSQMQISRLLTRTLQELRAAA